MKSTSVRPMIEADRGVQKESLSTRACPNYKIVGLPKYQKKHKAKKLHNIRPPILRRGYVAISLAGN